MSSFTLWYFLLVHLFLDNWYFSRKFLTSIIYFFMIENSMNKSERLKKYDFELRNEKKMIIKNIMQTNDDNVNNRLIFSISKTKQKTKLEENEKATNEWRLSTNTKTRHSKNQTLKNELKSEFWWMLTCDKRFWRNKRFWRTTSRKCLHREIKRENLVLHSHETR